MGTGLLAGILIATAASVAGIGSGTPEERITALESAFCRHIVDEICSAEPVPTATPTPTIVPTPDPTATPSATPTPTPVPTTTPVPPTPSPTLPPPVGVVGYGSDATGGSNLVTVSTYAAFKNALNSGNLIRISGSGVWDGNGDTLVVPANVTIDGEGSSVIFKDAWLRVTNSNVIVRHIRMRTGDDVSADADAINVNGQGGCISDIVLDHVEAIWAPDVGGLAILNCVTDMTVQHSIIGVGLTKSSHPESLEDATGHNMGFNIAGQNAGLVPQRITVFRNLITTSINRNPQVQGAVNVDLVNNVIYNFSQSPQGNPQGLNMVNNWFREGPAPEAAGVPERHWFWQSRGSSDHPSLYANSVYMSGNLSDGFTAEAPDSPGSVLRSTPYGTLSVQPESTTGLLSRVLGEVGPKPLDSRSLGWISQATNRTGTYYNGAGFPSPNPTWP